MCLCFVDFVRKWSYDFCIDHSVGTNFPLLAAMFSCSFLVKLCPLRLYLVKVGEKKEKKNWCTFYGHKVFYLVVVFPCGWPIFCLTLVVICLISFVWQYCFGPKCQCDVGEWMLVKRQDLRQLSLMILQSFIMYFRCFQNVINCLITFVMFLGLS